MLICLLTCILRQVFDKNKSVRTHHLIQLKTRFLLIESCLVTQARLDTEVK